MAQRLPLRNAALRFQDGGHVPGTGRGDNPGLREQLSGLRAEILAARGKTVDEADQRAPPSLVCRTCSTRQES